MRPTNGLTVFMASDIKNTSILVNGSATT
jgi:hypothetical protein